MDKIIIESEGQVKKEIVVPVFGDIKLIVQNGKVYKMEVTESTLIKRK